MIIKISIFVLVYVIIFILLCRVLYYQRYYANATPVKMIRLPVLDYVFYYYKIIPLISHNKNRNYNYTKCNRLPYGHNKDIVRTRILRAVIN